MTQISHIFDKKQQKNNRIPKKVARNRNLYYIYINQPLTFMRSLMIMARQSFLTALFGALLFTAAFAVSPLPLYTIETVTDGDMPIIQFSVAKNGGSLAVHTSIQAAIDAIIADATSTVGNHFAIQFETGTKVLDIGTAMATFGSSTGKININLSGKITSASGGSMIDGPAGTVIIGSGISVESLDEKENTMHGNAISVDGGELKIGGGTVKANTGNAVDFPLNGRVGTVILGGSPKITGTMEVRSGALSVADGFAPAEKQYTLFIGTVGSMAVVGGANFLSNFTLDTRSGNLILAKSGNDLVLATPSSSSSSNCGLVECLPRSSSSGTPSSSSVAPSSSSAAKSSSSVALSSSSTVKSSSSFAPSSSSAIKSSSSVVPSSSSAAPSSSSTDEISSSSEESIAPIANYTSPVAHSEIPTYYTIKGEPVGSIKPAKPGVYLVKQGNSVRKIAVR
jgi:hypothetical protein